MWVSLIVCTAKVTSVNCSTVKFQGKLTICSLNVRGLGDRVKRCSVFQFVKNKKADLVMLQETHSQIEEAKQWCMEWGGGEIKFAHGRTNARGVAILIHPKSEWSLQDVTAYKDGRILAAYAVHQDQKFLVCNVYAPNCDDETFFIDMVAKLDRYPEQEQLIIGGDFTLVMDPKMDRNSPTGNHHKLLEVVKEYMQKACLCDVWRVLNPFDRKYTWHKAGSRVSFSRIDLFLIPDGMVDWVEEVRIDTGRWTDHSLVLLKIRVDIYTRGLGIWKFNNNLLLDRAYVETLQKKAAEILKTCVTLNPNDAWEFFKMEMGMWCKESSIGRARKLRSELDELVEHKSELLRKVEENNSCAELTEELAIVESGIKQHAQRRAEGAIFRSRCKYTKEGERCTKYFLSLEKKQYAECNMTAVIDEEGRLSTNQKTIMDEQVKFYKCLYSKDADVRFALKPTEEESRLTMQQQMDLDQPLLIGELYDVVMTLRSNKVPGIDGLTVEFYRACWKQVSLPLYNMLQYSLNHNILPGSVCCGIIALLPKKNRDTRYVKNLRPLTLLNNDYKILAKALDNRLHRVLPDLVHTDQTGFVKGRKISHNVRKSLDIIEFTKKEKIPRLILSVDIEKCFNRLEHKAILGSLEYFNFGMEYRRRIALIYCELQICTQNFGFLSQFW